MGTLVSASFILRRLPCGPLLGSLAGAITWHMNSQSQGCKALPGRVSSRKDQQEQDLGGCLGLRVQKADSWAPVLRLILLGELPVSAWAG